MKTESKTESNTVSFNVIDLFTSISQDVENSGNELLLEVSGNNPLPHIGSEEAECKKEISEEFSENVKTFAEYLGVTPTQAILFAAIYSRQLINENRVDLEDIANFIGMNRVLFLRFRKDIKAIENRGLVAHRSHRRCGNNFYVPQKIEDALIDNVALIFDNLNTTCDRYEFCGQIAEKIDLRSDKAFDTPDLFIMTENEEKRYADLAFIQNAKKLIPNVDDRTLFYRICNDFVNNREHECDIDVAMSDIYESPRQRYRISTMLMNKSHSLFTSDIVELVPAQFFSNSRLTLSDKGKELFLEEDFKLFAKGDANDKRITPAVQLPDRQLFFEAGLAAEINFLKDSLMEEQFSALQERLSKKSMAKGVAILFYGLPGTGKTATAEMLAKATGRGVYHVDIAASKTCWFGESEKLVKRIFTDYAEMCKNCDKKPILLFNEADALFSKRKDSNTGNIAQTENAIQNIILEELEKLDGILIATTNLSENLDKAFSRRFLFKIKFGQPSMEAKLNIWKSKMPWLSDDECKNLAAGHNLSGGEIDNICRKAEMEEVLSGNRPDLNTLNKWCNEEMVDNRGNAKIGFTN